LGLCTTFLVLAFWAVGCPAGYRRRLKIIKVTNGHIFPIFPVTVFFKVALKAIPDRAIACCPGYIQKTKHKSLNFVVILKKGK
jgi:hypothetical protein